jgi:5-methylcytosine-specific restriction endonuclease McrA
VNLNCVRCGARAAHIHHRQLRRHGNETPDNLMPLCVDCHTEVHGSPAHSYATGFLVHSWDDPALVEVQRV